MADSCHHKNHAAAQMADAELLGKVCRTPCALSQFIMLLTTARA